MRSTWRYVVGAVAISLLVAACGGGGGGPEGATPPPGACELDADAVRVGVQGAMSGSHADYGAQIKMGATLAAEEINADGGIAGCRIDLKFADSEMDPNVGITNARRFVNDFGADFVVGVDSSGVALALAPVMKELDRILIVTHGGTEKLTEELVYEKGNKHVFRVSVPVYQDAIAAALLFKDDPELKRFATIGADYEYGRTAWEMFKTTMQKERPDVEFVAEAWAPFNSTDFSSQISAVMAAKPDFVFVTPWGGEAVTMVRQAQGAGVFDSIDVWWQAMGGSVDFLQGVTQGVQNDEFKGKLWATGRYLFNAPDDDAHRQFLKVFQKRFERFPNYSAATTYTSVYAIKKAVEKARSLKSEPVIKALEGIEVSSPLGPDFYIRAEDHQGVYSVPLGRIAFSEEYGMACVCEDLTAFEPEEYYRQPPFSKQ